MASIKISNFIKEFKKNLRQSLITNQTDKSYSNLKNFYLSLEETKDKESLIEILKNTIVVELKKELKKTKCFDVFSRTSY